MNLSLRQVKIDASQTMFITPSGTVLFTSNLTCGHHYSRTVITSIDECGSVTEVGRIKWNENTGNPPSLCTKAGLMELGMVGKADNLCTIFRASDMRIYRWRKTNGMLTLFSEGTSSVPLAIACDNTSINSIAKDFVLCIQPTGFHLLHEIIVTFVLYERLCENSQEDHDKKNRTTFNPRKETFIPSVEPRIKLTHRTRTHHAPPAKEGSITGLHVPCMRAPNSQLTRPIADLTDELLRRYNYPSAYGGFGDIWKCDWLKDSRVLEVAVKVMRTNLTENQNETQIKKISRELKVWVKLEHECVLPLYGITFDFGPFPAMVCPWLEGGALSKYLEHHGGLPLNTRLQLLNDIASGLQYLHGCGIVHGDLTGSNVLIKDNGKACLSDFGLSRIFMEATASSYWSSTIRGSVRWAAPELFEVDEEEGQEPAHVLPTPQSDIYSFGSTMLQVLTGKVPYHYYKYDAQVLVALSRDLRPVRPEEPPIDDDHWEFLQRCWASQSKRRSRYVRRPSIEEVVDFLSMAQSHCSRW